MRPFRLALSSFYSLPTSSSLSSFSSPSSSLFSLSHSTSVIPKTLLNRCSYCYNSSIPFLKQEEKVVETGTPEQADQYLKTLKAGQLISGSKWDYFINEGSTITTDQAYELLTYGRQAKMVTPKRYFSYLLRLAKSGDYIPFHTALSAMERDGVKQTNHMLYRLARAGYKDPNLISRCLCLLSLRSPSIAQLLPELVRLALFTCQAIVKFSPPHEDSKRLLRFFNRTPKKELGTPVYNFVLKFFNDRRDMAMTRAIYDEMVRKNVPRDMRSYEILIRGVDRQGFCQLLQEIKDMNVVLSAVAYTKLMERVCEDREDTMFISALHEMIYHNVPFDLYAYSAAIRGQLKYGHIDEAVGLLKQMLENKIFPDRFIVDLFIDAFKGRPDQIQEMEDMWVQIAIQREAISETAAATPSEVLPVLDEEW